MPAMRPENRPEQQGSKMKKIFNRMAVLAVAGAALVAMTATVQADTHSSIEYHGGKAAYDKRIEQAAIERAASKMGELRGSIKDDDGTVHILTEEDLVSQASQLGFPILGVPKPGREVVTGAVRIM